MATTTPRNVHQSPVERQIILKKKLIKRLEKEIEETRQECEEAVKNIRFRIQMAQALLSALEKGK